MQLDMVMSVEGRGGRVLFARTERRCAKVRMTWDECKGDELMN
jgi:hypothetical protein